MLPACHLARRTGLSALLMLIAPWQAGAQDTFPACSFDTTAVTRPSAVAIGLVATPGPGAPSVQWQHHLLVAQAVAEHFVAPAGVSLPLWARVRPPESTAPRGPQPHLSSGLGTEIIFHLGVEGRLRDTTVQVSTHSQEINEALIAAIRRADAAGSFPPAPGGRSWERGQIRLRLAPWDPPGENGVGLMRVTIPFIIADTPVSVVNLPAPAYPVGGQRAGAGDVVEVFFAVGTNGRVIPGSIRVVGGRYRQFVEAAVRSVERGLFNPARIRGCAVPMEVAQRMNFNIR